MRTQDGRIFSQTQSVLKCGCVAQNSLRERKGFQFDDKYRQRPAGTVCATKSMTVQKCQQTQKDFTAGYPLETDERFSFKSTLCGSSDQLGPIYGVTTA